MSTNSVGLFFWNWPITLGCKKIIPKVKAKNFYGVGQSLVGETAAYDNVIHKCNFDFFLLQGLQV